MKEKVQLTPEQLYKKNQKKSKIFKILAPVVYWVFIGLTILFFILTIKNSVGNITEIITLLDKDIHTGEQLAENYAYLVEKYGEWQFGNMTGTFSIQFINLSKALFSGLMITFLTFTIICFVVAIIVGKIVFPKLSQYYSANNQDMVNLATLQTNAEITRKKKNKEEEWF